MAIRGANGSVTVVDRVPSAMFSHPVPVAEAGGIGEDYGCDGCSGTFVQHFFSRGGMASWGWGPSVSSIAAPLVCGAAPVVGSSQNGCPPDCRRHPIIHNNRYSQIHSNGIFCESRSVHRQLHRQWHVPTSWRLHGQHGQDMMRFSRSDGGRSVVGPGVLSERSVARSCSN